MSLKILKISPGVARVLIVAAAIACLISAWFFIKWNFANAIASRMDPTRPESKTVADWLTRVAPNDPQTHFTAAALFEKTLDPEDLTRSLIEYETAAALSPNNYAMWLYLAKARSMTGDTEGAEAAFRRALHLGPNYSTVQWTFGNFLIRQGNTDEGFSLIAKAASSDPAYTSAAVVMAMQIFGGDAADVRRSLGEGDVTNAAFAQVLVGQKRYDDAYAAWSQLTDKTGKFKTLGETLTAQMADSKKFRLAALIKSDLIAEGAPKPEVGRIGNGGFEDGVKLRNAGLFEWQIDEGSEPQIGLSDGQKRTGKYSLWMLFDTFQTAAFRNISQTIPVVPGAEYEFEVFYRSDVKTNARLRWEVAEAATGGTLAATEPMAAAAEWVRLGARFTVPQTASDGIIIRLARDGCIGPSCPITGRMSFDDFSLRSL